MTHDRFYRALTLTGLGVALAGMSNAASALWFLLWLVVLFSNAVLVAHRWTPRGGYVAIDLIDDALRDLNTRTGADLTIVRDVLYLSHRV